VVEALEYSVTKQPPQRELRACLLIGMLVAPFLFVWVFLRKGYRPSLRRAALFYTGIQLLMAVTLIATAI
jgi:hypothetical protein